MAAAGFNALASAAFLALAACTSIRLDAGSVAGRDWQVTAVNGRTTPGGPDYHMLFQPPNVHAGFGCNGMMAEYRIQGDQLTLGRSEGARFFIGRIMATERDCSAELTGHFEADATAILVRPMTVRFADERHLALSNSAGSITLERIP